jgi:hypothetical protein
VSLGPFGWILTREPSAGVRDRYLVACMREQVLADAGAGAEALDAARAAATRFAAALAGLAPARPLPAPPAFEAPAAGDDKVARPVLPECLGYDLADVEVVAGDAAWWRARHAGAVWLVGLRTGGSYFAPMWSAHTGLPYTTVRPRRPLAPHALAALARAAPRPDHIVLLDDQIDTGAALAEVIAALAGTAAAGAAHWCASPGRIARWTGERWRRARDVSPVVPGRRRLWQLLGDADHPRLIARLRDAGLALPTAARVAWRARHGKTRAWLPWNNPRLASLRRRLINPRKSPFAIVDGSGEPALFARFIGEAIFGRAEADRVAAFSPLHPPSTFLDGYLLTPAAPRLRPFADAHAAADTEARRRMRAGVARYAALLAAHGRLVTTCPPVDGPVRVARAVERIARRTGARIAFALPIEPPAAEDVAVLSSLAYSHGAWHWAVDAHGDTHRFQVDATWGGISSIGLELAAFVTACELPPADAAALAAESGCPPHAIAAQLGGAALIALEAAARTVDDGDTAAGAQLVAAFERMFDHARATARTLRQGDP